MTQPYGPAAVAGNRVANLPQGSGYGYPPMAWQFQGAAVGLDAQRGAGSAAVGGPAESGSGSVFRPDVWCTSCGKEGHMDIECPGQRQWCDIFQVNSTNRCVYNGRIWQQQAPTPVYPPTPIQQGPQPMQQPAGRYVPYYQPVPTVANAELVPEPASQNTF